MHPTQEDRRKNDHQISLHRIRYPDPRFDFQPRTPSKGKVLAMLTLAWRNVWRNKRRSAITVTSIACGLAAIMFGQSMIKSIQVQLVEKATGIIIGHIRVMAPGNDDPKLPDKPIKETAAVLKALASEDALEGFEGRMLFT